MYQGQSCRPTDKKRSGGSEVGRWEETGRRVDDHMGGKPGRGELTAPPFSAPQEVAQAPRAQLLAQTKDLAASQPLQDEGRLSKAAMHPGGQERALQLQTTAMSLGLWSLPARQREAAMREGGERPASGSGQGVTTSTS